MAKFLTGNELNLELGKIFENAEKQIILISPYIKLHDRYASIFRTKKGNPNIKIIIVFGKNEEDISRSMKQEDFIFFKEFPNIEIHYEKQLHAKYYSNESSAILSSMNLYSYSQDNNIEAGILTKTGILGRTSIKLIQDLTTSDDLDSDASNYFSRVIDQSELLFKKTPEYESALLGFTQKYKSSKKEVDKLTDFFENRHPYDNQPKKDNYEKKSPYINKPYNETKVESRPESKYTNDSLSLDIKFLSTTALSKEMGISSKDLFVKFERLNWIEKKEGDWTLTNLGKSKGAQTKKGQYGEYISWPETIINEIK